jgi:hypothetical protein
MTARCPRAFFAAATLLPAVLVGATASLAQTGRAWVDPPTGAAAPPVAVPAPAPARPAVPYREPGETATTAPARHQPQAATPPPAITQPAPSQGAPREPTTRSAQPERTPTPETTPPVRSAQPERTPAPETTPPVRSAQPERAPAPDAAPPVRSAQPERAPAPETTPPVRSAQPESTPAPEAEPPVQSARPRNTIPPEPPPGSGDRPSGSEIAERANAAQELAVTYFDYWSSPNAQTLAATPEFYGSRVIFHGKSVTARELLEEKRRFVQRWPERRYRPRTDTMGVACEPGGRSCTVRSVFDFSASNPARGRRSQGIATIELVVSFLGERPVITAESSLVHGRGASRASLEDESNE